MTSISQIINFIVKEQITTFVFDDPIVHNACGFWAPNRLFYQSQLQLCVFNQILELLHALLIHNNLLMLVFIKYKKKQRFDGGHLGFYNVR